MQLYVYLDTLNLIGNKPYKTVQKVLRKNIRLFGCKKVLKCRHTKSVQKVHLTCILRKCYASISKFCTKINVCCNSILL